MGAFPITLKSEPNSSELFRSLLADYNTPIIFAEVRALVSATRLSQGKRPPTV